MKFYVIDKKPKGDEAMERYRTDFYFDEDDAIGAAPKCSHCGTFIGMLESLPPYKVHLETWGEDFGDLAFWLGEFLVSRKLHDEFLKSGLKGLSSFERVEVLSCKHFGKAKGKRITPPEYFRVHPTIGGARIDLEASGVECEDSKITRCTHCLSGGGILKRWQSVVVDEKSWNGNDIFFAFGISGELLASSRFFEWAKVYQFQNLIMKPAVESSHDFYPWEKLNPV